MIIFNYNFSIIHTNVLPTLKVTLLRGCMYPWWWVIYPCSNSRPTSNPPENYSLISVLCRLWMHVYCYDESLSCFRFCSAPVTCLPLSQQLSLLNFTVPAWTSRKMEGPCMCIEWRVRCKKKCPIWTSTAAFTGVRFCSNTNPHPISMSGWLSPGLNCPQISLVKLFSTSSFTPSKTSPTCRPQLIESPSKFYSTWSVGRDWIGNSSW